MRRRGGEHFRADNTAQNPHPVQADLENSNNLTTIPAQGQKGLCPLITRFCPGPEADVPGGGKGNLGERNQDTDSNQQEEGEKTGKKKDQDTLGVQ